MFECTLPTSAYVSTLTIDRDTTTPPEQ